MPKKNVGLADDFWDSEFASKKGSASSVGAGSEIGAVQPAIDATRIDAPSKSSPPTAPRIRRGRYPVNLPVQLIERVRDAAYWSHDTLASITERALAEEVRKMETERGAPFEPRRAELRPGRPIR